MTTYHTRFLENLDAELTERGVSEPDRAAIENILLSETTLRAVLKVAVRFNDERLTSIPGDSNARIQYIYTTPTGMTLRLYYPDGKPDNVPLSYDMPYEVFHSDIDLPAWRAAQDAVYAAQLQAEADALAAAAAAAAAAALEAQERTELARLKAKYPDA